MPRSFQQARKGKKRPKGFFKKSTAGKRPRLERKLDVGVSGIMITCNRDEQQCTKEAYDLLIEYADELYGPEVPAANSAAAGTTAEVDISDALEQEVAEMKQQQEQKTMRFQAIDSRAKNVIFIKTNIPEDPSKFVYHILQKLKDTGQSKFQHIQRMIPATVTCRAALEEIEKSLKPLLATLFQPSESKDVKYAILFKTRNNNQIRKEEVVKVVDNLIKSTATCQHSVDLNNAEYTILVEVICNVCCLSILRDYNGLMKYNARRLVGGPENPDNADQKQGGEEAGNVGDEAMRAVSKHGIDTGSAGQDTSELDKTEETDNHNEKKDVSAQSEKPKSDHTEEKASSKAQTDGEPTQSEASVEGSTPEGPARSNGDTSNDGDTTQSGKAKSPEGTGNMDGGIRIF